jgi:diguanylate cyclase (GGDEF)-like protein
MGIHEQDTAVTDASPSPAPVALGARDCLVLIHGGPGLPLGKVFWLEATRCRIGRSAENDIVLEDDRVSRHHVTLEARESRWIVRDEGSTNGTWIGDRKLEGYVQLTNTDRIKIGASIFKFLSGDDVESATHEEIYRLTLTDNLTNLTNRRGLQDELDKEFVRARRHGRNFCVLMVDIDHFKNVNDTHGHGVGDAVLAEVAATARSQTRDVDVVARYGGEEIMVIAPETTLAQGTALAERIRATVDALLVQHDGKEVHVTVSIGCAEFSGADSSSEALVGRADGKLYAAKRAGRNRVEY